MILDAAKTTFPEREGISPSLENGDYYEYADQYIPVMAETREAGRQRRRRKGACAVAAIAGLAGLSCLSQGLPWYAVTPAAPLAASLAPVEAVVEASMDVDPKWLAKFREFHRKFDKQNEYTMYSPEFYRRLDVFKANYEWIESYNAETLDVTLAPNQFMDMDWKEFKVRHLSPPRLSIESEWKLNDHTSRVDGGAVLGSVAEEVIPTEVNWVTRGCVTPVKNQAHCGSCWAFSSTGALEGAVCAQTNRTVSLSEQQLVDCGGPEGTMGCSGGFMDTAFQYVIDNGGLCTEESYPYEGVDTNGCRSSQCESAVRVKSIMDLPVQDEKALRAAIAFYGPVSVAIEADRPVFQFYHKGVLSVKCGKHLNHAVLAVGYGTEDGENYWLIKNSWGPTWGEAGFIKLTRDRRVKNGECGVLLAPVLPLIL